MTRPDTSAEAMAHTIWEIRHGCGIFGPALYEPWIARLEALAAERDALRAELRQRHGDTYTVNSAAEWQARAEAAEAEVARLKAQVREDAMQYLALDMQTTEAFAEAARLRELLSRWVQTGCPFCAGDCSSANPPSGPCLVWETTAALTPPPPARAQETKR